MTRARARVFPHADRHAAAWLVTLALVFAGFAVLSAGCTISPAYVAGDRKTFDAVAPEYRRYVVADPALPQAKKDRRLRTLQAWAARLSKAEADE